MNAAPRPRSRLNHTNFCFQFDCRLAKKKNSANGKFRLFDDFKINILTAQRAIKGIPFSPQSEMFDWDVMLSEAFSTAVCWEIVGRDQGETHRQESKHSAVM